MPQMTLSFADCEKLISFCRANDLKQYFIAKDQGAYLGASKGAEPSQQCLFYFRGCDPRKNPDSYYDNARAAFGGDDFGEHLDVPALESMIAKHQAWRAEVLAAGRKPKAYKGICWKVSPRSISMSIA